MIGECPRCGALVLQGATEKHEAWHARLIAKVNGHVTQEKVLDWPMETVETFTGEIVDTVDAEAIARRVREETEQRSGGRLSPDDRVAVESVVAEIVEEAAEAGALTAEPDPEPPPPPLARHPQVPEADWAALNREQQADVVARLERVARLNIIAGDPERHPTDIAAANKRIGEALGDLRDDYDFELLPAEDVMEADAGVRDKAPPPRISEQSPKTPLAVLQARRTYLRAKVGLPAEAEEDRQAELAEIESRLRAQGAAV